MIYLRPLSFAGDHNRVDGMITFLAHVHIFGATHVLSCYGDHGGVRGGGGMITLLAHVHIFDATQKFLSRYGHHGGVGMG